MEASASKEFTATVPLNPATVTWKVNGVAGGNSVYGTVTATTATKAVYRAPADVPPSNTVRVSVTSTAFPTKSATSYVTIIRPIPRITSVQPSSFPAGSFFLRLTGSNFTGDSLVVFDEQVLPALYVSPTELRVSGSASRAGQSFVAVRLPGPGSVTSAGVPVQVTNSGLGLQVTVSVSPASASVQAGQSRSFSAAVTGTPNLGVTWSVNGLAGGNAQVGTISPAGIYTAPATPPSPAAVTIRATSVQDQTAIGSATVTVTPAPVAAPVITSITPASVETGKAFTATLGGSGFAAGAKVRFGTQEANPTAQSATSLTASGSTTAAAGSLIAVTVVNPDGQVSNSVNLQVTAPPATSGGGSSSGGGGVSYLSAARLLDQAAFGPTPAEIARVQQLGINGWIDEQFTLPESQIPATIGTSASALQDWQLSNFAHARDQLRQRVAYSLGQIMVVSLDKLIYADAITPWMSLLSRQAFGNYRTLLREMTILPSMGKYLDLANSVKPSNGAGASENYPRELMQLFTIGLWKLNRDGSQQAIPAYDEAAMRQVSLALTGWTYPTAPGSQAELKNPEYFVGSMEPREASHDRTAKSFLGCTLPADQTVTQDLDGVINCLFQHPNMPPFLASRLIRSMVTSNPSAGYIDRVARVFENNGAGVRGDLKAVVKAILTDDEARRDAATADQGRLREPILHIVAFVRALNGQIGTGSQIAWSFENMGQAILTPPSVFNWFSPLYRIPRTTRFGPEFQIYSPSQSVERANFFYGILTSYIPDFRVDLSPFNAVASNATQLIDLVDKSLLYGRMPAAMRDSLTRAVLAANDNTHRVEAALYLTALSGYYSVQY